MGKQAFNPKTDAPTHRLKPVALLLRGFAHPTRLAIMLALNTDGPIGVSSLAVKLEVELTLLSHHLAQMRLLGIVRAQREGRNVYYTLRNPELMNILYALMKCLPEKG